MAGRPADISSERPAGHSSSITDLGWRERYQARGTEEVVPEPYAGGSTSELAEGPPGGDVAGA